MHESEVGLGHEIARSYLNPQSATRAGGACFKHGVYSGLSCPGCAEDRKERDKNHALAQFRQSVWEITQYLTTAETVEYFNGILDEIETDQP